MDRLSGLRPASWPWLIALLCVVSAAGCQDSSRPASVVSPDANKLEVAKKPPPPTPPNYEISTIAGDQIYIMAGDGSSQRLLIDTNDGYAVMDRASWSPDGSALTYMAWHSGIWTIDADGTNTHLLVPREQVSNLVLYSPVWSPDGDEIAFIACDEYGFCDVYVVPVTGGNPTLLYDHPLPSGHRIAWNSDGTKLALTARFDIVVIDRATGGGETVLSLDPCSWCDVWSIDWARNGVETLLFSTMSNDMCPGGCIYTLDISAPGQTPEFITNGLSPSYSPDNSKFVFLAEGRKPIGFYTFATGEIQTKRGAALYPDWRR